MKYILALTSLVVLTQSARVPKHDDEWEESSASFNGIFGDHVTNYTCGNIQIGGCSPRGGSCSGGLFGSGLNSQCQCNSGYYKSMCDWGPAPTDADPAPSNGIDWTADRVARVALALDASTAAYGNNTVNGVMLTTIESICPSLLTPPGL